MYKNDNSILSSINDTYKVSVSVDGTSLSFNNIGGGNNLSNITSFNLIQRNVINNFVKCGGEDLNNLIGEIPVYGESRKLFDDILKALWKKNDSIKREIQTETTLIQRDHIDNYTTNNISGSSTNKLINELNELLEIINTNLLNYLKSLIQDLQLDTKFASIFNGATGTTLPQDFFQGDEIEFIIDPITSPWNPNISDQNMHFIDTQTFLRRFIKNNINNKLF